jgi:tripartite-type tricarboxylate transporter receptor subunit TctC
MPIPRRTLLAAPALAVPAARTAAAQPALAQPALAQPALAQPWPSRPIRLVVASAPGGNADVVARIVAAALEPMLGQPILVQNLPAASGMRATETAARAEADGYTWLFGTSSQLVHNLALFEKLPVDIVALLRGVALVNIAPAVLTVPAQGGPATLDAYIEAARARAGAVELGSGPPGTTTHVSGLLFARAAGIALLPVPYNAGSLAMADMLAGRIASMIDISVTAIPPIQQGTVRGLAVAAENRLAALPDVPTMDEAGVPGFTAATWNSIAMPAETPAAIVAQLNRMVNAVVQAPAMRERLAGLGTIVPPPMSAPQVEAFYARERALWIPAVRATGVRAG